MKHNLCWSGYEKFLICNISIFLFRLLLKDFLQCLIKGAGTEDNSSIIICKERAAPALTTPAGVLFFNLFAASLPFFHLFSVACFGFSAAVIYSSVLLFIPQWGNNPNSLQGVSWMSGESPSRGAESCLPTLKSIGCDSLHIGAGGQI